MEPGALLDVLLAAGGRSERMTHVRHLPARAGTQADWPSWADPDLVQGYRALGVDRPWLHQVEAADAAWSRTQRRSSCEVSPSHCATRTSRT